MISHDQARSLISARYDELPAPAANRALQEHLASCAACRQFAAETDYLVTNLRALPQLPPSPRVSRLVRERIAAGGASPWGWLGATMRVVTSPGMAIGSSVALVAAFAFIIILAVRPLTNEPPPLATISAMADVIATPSPTAEATMAAPTPVPTSPAVAVPTQTPTVAPTEEPTAPPTNEPTVTPPPALRTVMQPTATTVAPTATPRGITGRETATSAVEKPVPTTAPPVPTSPPIVQQQSVPTATETPPQPTIAPANQSSNAFGEEIAPTVAAGNDVPSYQEPGAGDQTGDVMAPAVNTAEVGQVAEEPVGESGVTIPTDGDPAAAAVTEEAPVESAPEAAVPPTTEPTAGAAEAPPAPTATEVAIQVAEAPAGAAAAPPVLPERNGNEALGLSGDDLAAEIQATVQADLTTDDGPPVVPTPSYPLPAPGPGAGSEMPVIGAEVTGAPADAPLAGEVVAGEDATTTENQPLSGDAEPVTIVPDDQSGAIVPADQSAPIAPSDQPAVIGPADQGAAADQSAAVAPVDPVATEAALAEQALIDQGVPTEPPPVSVPLGAPEPGWPGIGGAGTQFQSSAGYSAIADGAGVTVFAPDGTPLGVIGGGSPVWSPWGTSILVIGPSGQGAVWDASAGLIPVEPAATAARDVPAGWLGGDPVVQRVYLDGSGIVELRVVPVTGAPGYALGTATTDSVFGEGVTAARLSPDGGSVSFYSGGQLYIAPAGDPASASPAG